MKKRRRARWAFAALVLVVAVDALGVEPHWPERTHQRIVVPLAAPLRVLHLTDLHGKGLGTNERAVLRTIEEEKPDVIVITGDTIDRGAFAPYAEFLGSLKAPLGVYAVEGNWEHWRPAPDEDAVWAAAGITMLRNEARRLRDDVWIVGLDDATAGRPDAESALAQVPHGVATIALFHSPLPFADLAGRVSVAFAGHTHAGQVRLPFHVTPVLPKNTGPYVEGRFDERGSTLYVSRGVGTSILPVRFFCRPEIAVHDLGP